MLQCKMANDMNDPDRKEITRKIYKLYWANPTITGSPYEYRINMWRFAMGLNETVDISMGHINKDEF